VIRGGGLKARRAVFFLYVLFLAAVCGAQSGAGKAGRELGFVLFQADSAVFRAGPDADAALAACADEVAGALGEMSGAAQRIQINIDGYTGLYPNNIDSLRLAGERADRVRGVLEKLLAERGVAERVDFVVTLHPDSCDFGDNSSFVQRLRNRRAVISMTIPAPAEAADGKEAETAGGQNAEASAGHEAEAAPEGGAFNPLLIVIFILILIIAFLLAALVRLSKKVSGKGAGKGEGAKPRTEGTLMLAKEIPAGEVLPLPVPAAPRKPSPLRDRIRNILAIMESARHYDTDTTSMTYDGIAGDESEYRGVVFMLKEVPDIYFSDEMLNPDGIRPHKELKEFCDNLHAVHYAITQALSGGTFDLYGMEKEKPQLISGVGIAAIKKKAKSHYTAPDKDVYEYARSDRKYIRAQINTLGPRIIYCCGKGAVYGCIRLLYPELADRETYHKDSVHVFVNNNEPLIIIDGYHIAPPVSRAYLDPKAIYDSLIQPEVRNALAQSGDKSFFDGITSGIEEQTPQSQGTLKQTGYNNSSGSRLSS